MAFIQGRKITDGILIANELDTRAKREIRQRPLLEVDFAKAFDSISWTFLDSVLSQMNFGVMWRTWIKGCLQSARVSVLVNGSPTQEFSMERGLCQGDPLSPFLFILVAEALNTMMNEAVSRRLFHPVTLESNGVQHLQFSDDVNFFGTCSTENPNSLIAILQCFESVSGIHINLTKTRLYAVGVDFGEVTRLAQILTYSPAKLPFFYLGLPVGSNMSQRKSWDPVIKKLEDRLSTWKVNSLSIGDRLTLIKSILGSISLYFSVFHAPAMVVKRLKLSV